MIDTSATLIKWCTNMPFYKQHCIAQSHPDTRIRKPVGRDQRMD